MNHRKLGKEESRGRISGRYPKEWQQGRGNWCDESWVSFHGKRSLPPLCLGHHPPTPLSFHLRINYKTTPLLFTPPLRPSYSALPLLYSPLYIAHSTVYAFILHVLSLPLSISLSFSLRLVYVCFPFNFLFVSFRRVWHIRPSYFKTR